MNQILVLKDEAYLAGTPGAVAAVKEITNLKQGSLAMVLEGKVLLETATKLAGLERVQLVAGIARGTNTIGNEVFVQSSVPIARRQVLSVNFEEYVAPVTQKLKVGPFPWAADSEGDVGLTINDNSFVRTIQTNQIRISEYKTKAMTPVAIIDKMVARINSGTGIPGRTKFNSFCTAVKIGTTVADLAIELTMKSEHVDLSVALDGLLATGTVATTREAVISLGKGEDVLRTEQDYSGNLGNGGYWGYNEGYFSKGTEAQAGTNYDIFQIKFQGEHDTPQNRQRAAVNHLMIAVPTGAALVATLKTHFANLFGKAFTSDEGALVPTAQDAKETDKDPKTSAPIA